MAHTQGNGAFLSLGELTTIFSRFKNTEHTLSAGERELLLKIEKTLYEYLSVAEVEELCAAADQAGGRER